MGRSFPSLLRSHARLFSSISRSQQALRRTLLYVPGSSEKMLAKSATLKADAIAFDLEDSVSKGQKISARKLVATYLNTNSKSRQERIVRINARASGLAEDDLTALHGLAIDTIMLPKVETADDIRWLASHLPPTIQIIAMIESPLAVMNLKEIATAHERLTGLVFAAEDFAASMNITRSVSLTEMAFARQAVVIAAKAYGLDAIDLVCTSYKDSEKLKSEAENGAAFGFSGKQAIHPNQLSIIEAAYSPSMEQVQWAQGLLAKHSAEDRGAFEYKGQMVDAPVILNARRILSRHTPAHGPVRGLLLGAPGAGKGTQSKRIMAKFPAISILSSGDLLRDHMSRGTALGIQAKDTIARGALVEDDVMCNLVTATITERGLTSKSFFLDGFPRTVAQAEALNQYLCKLESPLNFVVNLDVPYSVILDRIINRWIHAPSGRTYNLTYNPPKVSGMDDVTGEPLSKRVDDDVETFKRRLQIYDETNVPLLTYYEAVGILRTFTGETSDAIWPQIEAALEGRTQC